MLGRFPKYRKFKRPFRAVWRIGDGRASAGLAAGRTFASGILAARGRAARRWWSFCLRFPTAGKARRCGLVAASCCLALFRLPRRGRRGATRPRRAVRAGRVGNAFAPTRRALRSGRGMDDPLRVWRGSRWVVRCWPRSVACRRSGRTCSRRCQKHAGGAAPRSSRGAFRRGCGGRCWPQSTPRPQEDVCRARMQSAARASWRSAQTRRGTG